MLIEKSSQTAGPATRQKEKKKSDTFHLRKACTNRKTVCRVVGSVDVDGSTSPHLPEALCRALRQSWTENGSLWPALNGTRTHVYKRQIDRERETVIAVTMLYRNIRLYVQQDSYLSHFLPL